jgi:soluble lytic murein transglycosylase-like protein
MLALAEPVEASGPASAATARTITGDSLPTPTAKTNKARFGPEFWTGVRDVARSVREFEAYSHERYARRYNISADLARTIVEVATAEGIDPDLAFRLVRVESRFNVRARGPGGSLGLTQLMPATARSLDRSLRTDAQILDPETNLQLGFRYLRRMIERYDGDVRLGLLAYNRGPVAVDRALANRQDPENGYSRRVLGTTANRYQGPGLLAR